MSQMIRIKFVYSVVIFACLLWSVSAGAVVEIDHPVVDETGVLTGTEVDRISEKLFAHHEATGIQMAVLFVDDTDGEPIEDYALKVAENWEGGSAERDDGILLVFAIDDRQNRLELGYGIEPMIADAQAAQMLDAVTGKLRESRYGDAAEAIVDSVITRTEHVQPGGEIPQTLSNTWAMLATLIVYLYAMLQGYVWRRLRGEVPTGGDDIDDDDDDDDDIYAKTFEKEPSKLLGWFATLLCWVPPPIFIVLYVGDGQIPATWDYIGTSLAAIWLIAVWGISAVLGAFVAKHGGWVPFFIVMYCLFHVLGAFVGWQWYGTATESQVFTMFVVGINAYVWIWVFIFIGLLFAHLDGTGGGSGGTFSSGGMSSGGGGGFSSGGGGGFSGGGGSFGGGGASGGW